MPNARLEGIRASAGAGKTYQLTTRYLSLLADGQPPETILATTFTRKAAGEILGRVMSRLAGAVLDAQTREELRRDLGRRELTAETCRSWLVQLTGSLHRTTVLTLDSLFARLAHGFRNQLDLPAGASPLDANSVAAVQLRAAALAEVLQEDLEGVAELLGSLLPGEPRGLHGRLDALMAELYSAYQDTFPAHWDRSPTGDDPGDDPVEAARYALLSALASPLSSRFKTAVTGDLESLAQENWTALLQKGLGPKVRTGDLYYRQPIPDALIGPYQTLIARAAARVLNDLAARTRATGQLLDRYQRQMERLQRSRRLVFFGDVPRALSVALAGRDLAEVAYRLDARVQHLLLDEFQDTSVGQWEILRPFALEIRDSAPGTLFAVGDGKQAIYTWRGGCAEIFDRLGEDLPTLEWADLNRNFRSAAQILAVVDRVFEQPSGNAALPGFPVVTAAWEARYQPHTAARAEPGYVALVVSPAGVQPDDEAAAETSDPDGVASGEAAMPRGHEEYVAAEVARLSRAAPGATLGVLLRTNAAAQRLLTRLRGLGIPASGEGEGALDDDAAVETILSALTLADHPGDSAAAHHALQSPLGPLLGVTTRSGDRIARAAREIRSELLTQGYPAVLGRWARLLAPEADARTAERLTQLLELADRWEAQPGTRPADFVRFVRGTPMAEPGGAPVRVMSIHRAKGLEFDIVVLPELHSQIGQVRGELWVDRPDPLGPVQGVYRRAPELARSLSPVLQAAFDRQQAVSLRESLCLLYVAMTRARRHLLLLIPPLKYKANGEVHGNSLRLSPANLLRAALAPGVPETAAGGETLFTIGDAAASLQEFAREQPASEPEPLPGLVWGRQASGTIRETVTPSSLEGRGPQAARDLLWLPTGVSGAEAGSLFHAWLSGVSWSGEGLPPAAELLATGRRAVPGQATGWYAQNLELFRGLLATDALQEVLTPPALPPGGRVELWRERRFAVRAGDRLLYGAFDRVVVTRDAAGQPLAADLLDFKTDQVAPDGVPARAALYAPQLQAYREALQAMLGLPAAAIQARLVFFRPGVLWSLTAGGAPTA
ncbi:MAG: UvrD-helicase domain-containing protein [Actinomycetota bacterium]